MTATATKTAPARRRGRPRKKVGNRGRTIRKTAPDVDIVNEVYRDERRAKVDQARKALGDRANGMEFRWGRGQQWREDPDFYTTNGYVLAELPQENGTVKHWFHKGDPLLMIDKDTLWRRRAAPGILAREELEGVMDGDDPKYGPTDEEGVKHGLFQTED